MVDVRKGGTAVLEPARPKAAMADWTSLGGTLTSAPALCSWGPRKLAVFGRGPDNALWYRFFIDGIWREWKSLGGGLTSPPAAISWGNGRIDVFARGTDNALWHRAFTGGNWSWSRWESLGGVLSTGPAVASWGPRRLDVFVRGTDNTIFQRTFHGSWRPWRSLAEPETTTTLPGLAAVSSQNGKIDLFAWSNGATDEPGRVVHFLTHKSFRDEAWTPAQTIGLAAHEASTSTSLAAAAWKPDRLDWFMRGADNSLWHSEGFVSNGGVLGVTLWPEMPLGGALTSGPAAVARRGSGNWIDVVVRGTDNAYWHSVVFSHTHS